MPVWLVMVIAIALAGLGWYCQQSAITQEHETAVLLAIPEPAAQPISTFDATPKGQRIVEAHVTARWALEYNTRLFTTEKSGRETPDGSFVLLMRETAAGDETKEVAAVIHVKPKDQTKLLLWLVTRIKGATTEHPSWI
jgi:hypothetical protein